MNPLKGKPDIYFEESDHAVTPTFQRTFFNIHILTFNHYICEAYSWQFY